MKVYFVVKGWWNHGGVETFCRNIDTASKTAGRSRFSFLLYGQVPQKKLKEPHVILQKKGSFGLFSALKVIVAEKPDWVILNQPSSLVIAPIIKLATKSKVAYIIHIDLDRFGHNATVMRIFKWLCNTFLDLVLSMTEDNRQKLINFGITTDVQKFYPPLITNEDGYKNESKPKTIDVIFFGRMAPQKDPHFFLDVIENVFRNRKNLNVIMIGSGELEGEVDERIAQPELKCVKRLPAMDQKELKRYVQRSKVFMMTSLYEGLGFVLVEALSWGTEVIVADIPVGPREILDTHPGLVQRDRKLFAQKLLDLLDNECSDANNERSNQRTNEKTRILANFDFQQSICEFEKLLITEVDAGYS